MTGNKNRGFLLAALVSFAERGFPQANRITLTKFCRCNNSTGDDLGHHGLTGVLKLSKGGFKSFAHHRNDLRFERARLYECTDWHGAIPPAESYSTVKNNICHKNVIK